MINSLAKVLSGSILWEHIDSLEEKMPEVCKRVYHLN